MGCLFPLAVVTVALAVLSGRYFMAIPVSSDIEQPWLYKVVVGLEILIQDAEWLYSLCSGGDPWLIHMELMRDLAIHARPAPVVNLQEKLATMAGIPVLVTRTKTTSATMRPAVVYIHGGGFATGSIYSYDILTARLATETDAVIFNVDYRLSVEVPSPAQLDDCYAVAMELYSTAETWGVDKTKIFVAGDSAGGTLAAALSLRLRDEESSLKCAGQILLYPWLQMLDLRLPSFVLNEDYQVKTIALAKYTLLYHNFSKEYADILASNNHLSDRTLEKYSDLVSLNLLAQDMIPLGYKHSRRSMHDIPISEEFEKAITNPYNWPLMDADLTNLPDTFIMTVESDILRDDGLLYARRLEDAGNDVTLMRERGGWHGMMSFMHPPISIKAAHRAADEMVIFMRSRILLKE